jgi:hypothetical protein
MSRGPDDTHRKARNARYAKMVEMVAARRHAQFVHLKTDVVN